jgi:hypothetical protein
VRELSDGLSNIVLLAEWTDESGRERRWVAKQSLEKLRATHDWRSERGRILGKTEPILVPHLALADSALLASTYIDR